MGKQPWTARPNYPEAKSKRGEKKNEGSSKKTSEPTIWKLKIRRNKIGILEQVQVRGKRENEGEVGKKTGDSGGHAS